MNIYTLNVGQGQFVVVTGGSEAFVIDTHVPLNPATPIVNVKSALAIALSGKNLVGLIVTGFDSDHFNEIGLRIVLNKYRPNWIAYPKYFKRTQCAAECFGFIDAYDRQNTIQRVSFSLTSNAARFYTKLSKEFDFEMFSPHAEDMNSSNNCSLVCKVTERATKRSYLVTGDTEADRWASVVRIFGDAIKCDVMAAPHHGSSNGVTSALMQKAKPHTVLISAGVKNQYGHPDRDALERYRAVATHVWSTNWTDADGLGQSLRTEVLAGTINTVKFEP